MICVWILVPSNQSYQFFVLFGYIFKMNFGEENYEMPDDLFVVSIEHLGVTDINVLQKEINRKINQLSDEAEAVVRRKHHTEKKNPAAEKRRNLDRLCAVLRRHSRNMESQKKSLIDRGMTE